VHASEIKEIWKICELHQFRNPDPMILSDELIRTVAGLKRTESVEEQDGKEL